MSEAFWRKKRVFVTGHTGFKGSWLSLLLHDMGADVIGYSLPPEEGDSLFRLIHGEGLVRSIYGDVGDFYRLQEAFDGCSPQVVLHLAAQPLVAEGYRAPLDTFMTNVMGTVNLLECIRLSETVRSAVIITTDKVYRNREWPWGYRETDELMGRDPYSASKGSAEIAVHSYRESFLRGKGVAVSTARAGNVIGGGDFSPDRIVPDLIRAALSGSAAKLRHPGSVRPYQHVIEPLFAYLLIARRQYEDISLSGSYNVGPDEADSVTTGRLADIFCERWGEGASWEATTGKTPRKSDLSENPLSVSGSAPPSTQYESSDTGISDSLCDSEPFAEAGTLRLDSSLIKARLGWRSRWSIAEAVQKTVEWTKAWRRGEEAAEVMRRQISEYVRAQ